MGCTCSINFESFTEEKFYNCCNKISWGKCYNGSETVDLSKNDNLQEFLQNKQFNENMYSQDDINLYNSKKKQPNGFLIRNQKLTKQNSFHKFPKNNNFENNEKKIEIIEKNNINDNFKNKELGYLPVYLEAFTCDRL